MLHFFFTVDRLKETPRRGWVTGGIAIKDAESVADHMYSMAMICLSYEGVSISV